MTWRKDYDNAPSKAYEYFLVRQIGTHSGSGELFIPNIVHQIDGKLYSPSNEIEPLVFGADVPEPDWRKANMEWQLFPEDWLKP